MNEKTILVKVWTRCTKNRMKGWSLSHDIEHHSDDNFLVDLALNIIEGTYPPAQIEQAQWDKWMAEDYEDKLIRAIALLVQEVERQTEMPL